MSELSLRDANERPLQHSPGEFGDASWPGATDKVAPTTNVDLPLGFDTFTERQNNFYLHFVGEPGSHFVGDIYRSQEPYRRACSSRRFARLATQLRATVVGGTPQAEWPADYQRELYRAYLLMHPFAADDALLFV